VSGDGTVTGVGPGTTSVDIAVVLNGVAVKKTVPLTVVYTPVTSLSLDASTAQLTISDVRTITADVQPTTADDKRVVWSVTGNAAALFEAGTNIPVTPGVETNVLSVDVKGLRAGQATVTATSYDVPALSASCTVTVSLPPAPQAPTGLSASAGESAVTLTWNAVRGNVDGYRVYVNSGSGFVKYGADLAASQLRAVVYNLAKGRAHSFAVTAFNQGGESVRSNVATATIEQQRSAADPEPIANVTAIKSPQKTFGIVKGKTLKLPVVTYVKGKIKAKLTYKSANKKIATVTAAGKVKGVRAGKTTITVTADNGKRLKLKIVVAKKKVKAKAIRLVKPPKSIKKGQTKWLTAKLSPAAPTGLIVKFKSSKKSVIKVDKAGRITAVKKGTAKITVSIGAKKKTYTIRVK
jgi:uncharacterized protein YjdB